MPKIEKMRAFIIKFIFYALITGLIYVAFKYAMPLLMPFLFGFLIAFCLNPLANLIVKKTKTSRKVVSILLLLAFYAVVGSLITILGTRFILFLRDAFLGLPAFYDHTIAPTLIIIQDKLELLAKELNPTLIEFIDMAGQSIANNLSSLVSSVSGSAISFVTEAASRVPSFFVKFLLTIIVSFFCVVDYYTITSFITKQMPPKAKDLVFKIKTSGIDVVFKFAKAYAILLSLTFIELSIGLTLFKIPNSILLAFFISLVDILPILGTGTIIIPWGVICLILGNYPLGIGLLIMYLIITVVRQSLEPKVVGKQIGLYPLVTLVCMFIGAQLFGFVGLFGLPIAVTIVVQLNRTEELHLFK